MQQKLKRGKTNMKKIIRNIGNSIGIIFNKEEKKIYQLQKGEVIEIEIKKHRTEMD